LTLPKIETKKIIVGLVITAAGLLVVLALRFTGTLETTELSLIDFRFLTRGPLSGIMATDPIDKDSLDVVIVSLDVLSYKRIRKRVIFTSHVAVSRPDKLF